MSYTPSTEILDRYADVLVNFALNEGKGVRKGDVVCLSISESAKPLLKPLENAITRAGAHYVLRYLPEGQTQYSFSRDFYGLAAPHQLSWAPLAFYKGLVKETDHIISIGSSDPRMYEGVDAAKLQTHRTALAALQRMYRVKEDKGKLSWTFALYGTETMAREAGLSLEEYWSQIVKACFLDKRDPVKELKRVHATMIAVKGKLDALKIDKLHVEGPDADLWITPGEKRRWLGAPTKNIPSFEIFCSPDWRGTEGWMRFDQPLYYLGTKVEGIELVFKQGKVATAKARHGEELLKKMIAEKNGDKVGEFSLTDKRLSRITRFMAHTLYDENRGGAHGNTHIALGNAYREGYARDLRKLSERDWERLGFNSSAVHTDIISTSPRTVTAYLKNGATKAIYKNGRFVL